VVAFEEMLLVKDVTLSLAPLSFARLAFVEAICYTVSAWYLSQFKKPRVS
jgi:hypothetical protein